ncbi:MAG: chromosomal replication initiator protein DnaA [Magnetococcales bacterium]|nr:chromosomal replication initiator protein DnaA [Magnetococcales bacterium]
METMWQKTLELMQEQVSRQVFDVWIKPLQPVGQVENNVLELLVDNEFAADRIRTRYGALLESCLASETGQEIRILFRIKPPLPPEPAKAIEPAKPVVQETVVQSVSPGPVAERPNLDPRYTFASFVIGSCNQFAHAVAERVAEAPTIVYNPLFIYGGVGLGKTHIMQAIGHRILEKKPQLRVVYLSSEKFMTQLINSLRDNRVLSFREMFRSVDILLVDDIQFIAGKKATQEEFFHTFNALYESNKQIILTCDTLPKDIGHLEERLRSRFSMGLTADMQPPELETRVAILKKKAAMEGLELMDDVACFLAEAVQTNVRELEGALIRVSAYASLTNRPITLALVRETLRDLVRSQSKSLTIADIQKTVANFYNIRQEELLSGNKSRLFSHPRQMAMYLCKQLTKHSYPEIAHHFQGRDHTTILYAVKSIENKKSSNPSVVDDLEQLTALLNQ